MPGDDDTRMSQFLDALRAVRYRYDWESPRGSAARKAIERSMALSAPLPYALASPMVGRTLERGAIPGRAGGAMGRLDAAIAEEQARRARDRAVEEQAAREMGLGYGPLPPDISFRYDPRTGRVVEVSQLEALEIPVGHVPVATTTAPGAKRAELVRAYAAGKKRRPEAAPLPPPPPAEPVVPPESESEVPRLGVTAQAVERSPMGRAIVSETSEGKALRAEPAMGAVLAALGSLHQRLEQVEEEKKRQKK